MRRATFLKSLAVLAAAGGLVQPANAASNLRLMIPANPGGGWDSMGRALGQALMESGAADAVVAENKGGAAGAIGLAQFYRARKGDPDALLVMGAVMLGGIIATRPPVSLTQLTPIARLTNEYNVFVLPARSPFQSLGDVIAQFKKNPGSIKWGGGSRGSTEHIALVRMAHAVGVPVAKINYLPFRGGGEAAAAILSGHVAVGGSGYSEFARFIARGEMTPIAVTSGKRLPGIDVPTLIEQGINVEMGNWRGVYAASGISPSQRAALTEKVVKATASSAWREALVKNGWTEDLLVGEAFDRFVEHDFAALRATMERAGMV